MKNKMHVLLETAGITIPPIGVYDVPDVKPFHPFANPGHCVFGAYADWLKGESSVISHENAATYGCPGAAYWLCGIQSIPREDVAGYLAGQEGLKGSVDIMCRWLDSHPPYTMENSAVVISRLREDQSAYLKTVTFFVNPDQLALLLTGAEYWNASPDQMPVTAPYGSGCGHLLSMLRDFEAPGAVIGATDIAMRKYLPRDLVSFTVTKPMFEQLCGLDENSFLSKTFWKEVLDTRAAAA